MTSSKKFTTFEIKNKKAMRYTILLFLIFSAGVINSQSNRILLDENFSDWTQTDLLYTDTQGDYGSGEQDFLNLSADNDENYLFIRFEIADGVVLSEDNAITLYMDTDNNAATGRSVYGVGAEFEFTFGTRSGILHLTNGDEEIVQSGVGLFYSPAVSSNQFEVAIKKYVSQPWQTIFTNSNIKILLISNSTVGDRLPNEDGGVTYTFKNETLTELPQYSITKQSNSYLRIMSYNPERIFINNEQIDGIFDPDRVEHHRKIFQAIQPDIIGLVEIYAHNSQETADQISTFISSSPADRWYNSKITYDIVLLSKFPIKQETTIDVLDDNFQSHAALLDLRPKFDTDLLVILAHPKCCSGGDARRQSQVDAIMQFVKSVKDGVSPFTVESQIPIVIMGDMNFVGLASQRSTILTGDIFDNQHYGSDFTPDWDNTNFEDLKPYTTNMPTTFTSYNEESDYSPGRLDYIFYSGSVMEAKNSFALFTEEMPSSTLNEYGFQYNTTTLASDHLPVVADFALPYVTSVGDNGNGLPQDFFLDQNFPNPFNPETMITYSVPPDNSKQSVEVRLKIYDVLGKEIATLVDKEQSPGLYQVKFDTREYSELASGIYFYAIQVDNNFDVKKMTLLK